MSAVCNKLNNTFKNMMSSRKNIVIQQDKLTYKDNITITFTFNVVNAIVCGERNNGNVQMIYPRVIEAYR